MTFFALTAMARFDSPFFHERMPWLVAGALIVCSAAAVIFSPVWGKLAALPVKWKSHILFGATVASVLFFIGAAVSLANMGRGVMIDEGYTLATVRHPWADLFSLRIGDTHPPFFYIFAKCWAALFGSEASVMKMCAIAPFAAVLLLAVTFLRREFGARAALVFSLLINAVFLPFYYSVEIRDYSMALFFVTLTAVAGYYVIEDNRETLRKRFYVLLFFATLLSVYTHYYAGAMSAFVCGIVFVHAWFADRRKIKPLLITGVAVALGFLPWCPTFFHVSKGVSLGYFLPPLDIHSALAPLWAFFANDSL